MQLNLVLPLPISINKYLNYKVVWIGSRPVPQAYKPKAVKDYEKYATQIIKRELSKQNWCCDNKDNYLNVELTYYLEQKRKDSHNLEKVLFDVLVNAGVFPDDDILLPWTDNIYMEKKNPRVEVRINVAEKRGIFNNENHLHSFKTHNCNVCKKSQYKRSCGVMSRALDNRLNTEEININDGICHKIMK